MVPTKTQLKVMLIMDPLLFTIIVHHIREIRNELYKNVMVLGDYID